MSPRKEQRPLSGTTDGPSPPGCSSSTLYYLSQPRMMTVCRWWTNSLGPGISGIGYHGSWEGRECKHVRPTCSLSWQSRPSSSLDRRRGWRLPHRPGTGAIPPQVHNLRGGPTEVGSATPPPPLGGAMREAGLKGVEVYIPWRHNSVAQYIARRLILDVCVEEERRKRLRVSNNCVYR